MSKEEHLIRLSRTLKMNLNKKEKVLLKTIKSHENKQRYLITAWLGEFPCELYFKKSHCILEDVSPEKLYKFIKNNEKH